MPQLLFLDGVLTAEREQGEVSPLHYGHIGKGFLFAPDFGHRPASFGATRLLIDALSRKTR